MPKWHHSPTYINQRGRVRVVCTCGSQSIKLNSVGEAAAWYKRHTGIVERSQRREE